MVALGHHPLEYVGTLNLQKAKKESLAGQARVCGCVWIEKPRGPCRPLMNLQLILQLGSQVDLVSQGTQKAA